MSWSRNVHTNMRLQSLLVISLHLACWAFHSVAENIVGSLLFCSVGILCSVSFQSNVLRHLVIHGSCNFRQKNFVDFSRIFKDKLQLSRTKIYSINRQSLTSFWTPYLLKQWWSHLRILLLQLWLITLLHATFHNDTSQNDRINLQFHLSYRNSILNKEKEITYCSCTKLFLRFTDFWRLLFMSLGLNKRIWLF